ncbi:MAG: nucleoside deaminase [Desulfovibrio sp.]|nr:nucleoside deaminase [Desulfovibrio sp.]MBI4961357.1 nucleoside deaminase [Desulfovibrio sp.]
MQKSKRDFLKATATIGAFLFSTAVTLPARHALAAEKTGSEDWKPSSDTRRFPLDYQQILKHLRAANDVAKEAAEFGHHPFGAVLVAPDGEKVLMKQGNLNSIQHAETELSRRAFAQYNPEYLWRCTLVTTFEPCVMCAGNVYWANIGNLVYGVEETTLKKLTGASKDNPTMNLPCRTVYKTGQKPILVVGPFPELEDELVAPHRTFWK